MKAQLNLFDEQFFYEGVDVEYKAAKGGLPKSLWDTYSAFANTQGGTIYLGITERVDSLQAHGLEKPQDLLKQLWDTVNNPSKVNKNILTNQSVTLIPVPDDNSKVVIKITVPRADRRQRPIYVSTDAFKGTYRRNHEGDYLCSDIEVRRMFADQSEEPADSRILPYFGIEDIHFESLAQFRNLFRSRDSTHAWLLEDDKVLLSKLGGWRKDRASGVEGLTVAGLLMFGKAQSILDPDAIPKFNVDYRERISNDPAIRWTDRLTYDGKWEANIFQFYQRVIVKLHTHPLLKVPFQLDADGFRQAATPVHEALQEALVNALIHADYSGQGGIVIESFPDRFELSNPGTLLVSREQLLQGAVSECRNLSLQRMFQMLGVGDKAGSGIDKIRNSWSDKHWQSPSFEETLRPDRVHLTLSMNSILPDDIMQPLHEFFGEKLVGLDKDAKYVLAMAAIRGEVNNGYLQGLLNLHATDITKLLQSIVRQEFLVPSGEGRGRSYHLPETYYSSDDGSIPHKDGSIPHNDESSYHNENSIPHNEQKLLAIAQPARDKRRLPLQQMQLIIVALCHDEFLTPSDLGRLLDRSPDKVRDRYLAPLVEEGLLLLRHPNTPKHPLQAYKTAMLPAV